MRRPLIGLDIDSSSVKMVRLRRRSDGYTVVGASVSEVAPWGDDPDLHRANTIEAVRTCFEGLGPGKKLAVCGLRGPDVVVRGFEFPALPPEETQGAVELETSQMCPFGMDDGALDHQVIPTAIADHDGKTRGFWVAANRGLVEDRQQLVREAGLQCVLMDVDGLALLNCLEHTADGRGWGCDARDGHVGEQTTPQDPTDERHAPRDENGSHLDDGRPVLLDMGDSHASIAVVDHACRPFVRDVSSGGYEIMWQMAREMRLSLDEVRDALLGEGQSDMADFDRSLERVCSRLLEDIVTTLRYFAAQNRSTRVNRMLVSGSFAKARGFVDLLAAKLPIDVVLWNPVGKMARDVDTSAETVLEKAGPALTVAAGLALRTI